MIDETKEYNVQNMSGWSTFIFIMSAPILMFTYIIIVGKLGGGILPFIVGVLIVAGCAIALFRYLHQKLLVTVSKEAIDVHYLGTPFFESPADMHIPFSEIKSYKFRDAKGAQFTLYLKDGRRFRAAVGNTNQAEPIEQMANHIIALIGKAQMPGA